MNFEQEIRQIRDILVIMIEVQRRQAEVQKMQAEGLALHEERMKHIEMTLAEVSDKLNALAGFVDNSVRRAQ
jgi:hypothetical protein